MKDKETLYSFESPFVMKAIQYWLNKKQRKGIAKTYTELLNAWHELLLQYTNWQLQQEPKKKK